MRSLIVSQVVTLPGVSIPGHESSGIGNERHPMRVMTRRVAGLEAGAWDDTAKKAVTGVFDTLASEWHTRSSPQRSEVVADALRRGLDAVGDGERTLAIEAGAGIGTYSDLVSEQFRTVLSLDLSFEMIVRSTSRTTQRVVSDASQLPVGSRTADSMVLINAFVFPTEVMRVLKPGGTIIWVNSSGDQTPIHLSTQDLVKALPFEVRGLESTAGAGSWCVLVRDD